jgi:hypothetical protein
MEPQPPEALTACPGLHRDCFYGIGLHYFLPVRLLITVASRGGAVTCIWRNDGFVRVLENYSVVSATFHEYFFICPRSAGMT